MARRGLAVRVVWLAALRASQGQHQLTGNASRDWQLQILLGVTHHRAPNKRNLESSSEAVIECAVHYSYLSTYTEAIKAGQVRCKRQIPQVRLP